MCLGACYTVPVTGLRCCTLSSRTTYRPRSPLWARIFVPRASPVILRAGFCNRASELAQTRTAARLLQELPRLNVSSFFFLQPQRASGWLAGTPPARGFARRTPRSTASWLATATTQCWCAARLVTRAATYLAPRCAWPMATSSARSFSYRMAQFVLLTCLGILHCMRLLHQNMLSQHPSTILGINRVFKADFATAIASTPAPAGDLRGRAAGGRPALRSLCRQGRGEGGRHREGAQGVHQPAHGGGPDGGGGSGCVARQIGSLRCMCTPHVYFARPMPVRHFQNGSTPAVVANWTHHPCPTLVCRPPGSAHPQHRLPLPTVAPAAPRLLLPQAWSTCCAT